MSALQVRVGAENHEDAAPVSEVLEDGLASEREEMIQTGRRVMRLARIALAVRPSRLPTVNYDQRKSLPEIAAVYLAVENGRIIYIGQTINLRRRWQYHHLNYYPCTLQNVKISYIEEPNKFNREYLESLLIVAQRPKFNGHGVSAKSTGIISINLRKVLRRAETRCKSYSWDEKPANRKAGK